MRRSLFLALTLALAQFGCNEKRGQGAFKVLAQPSSTGADEPMEVLVHWPCRCPVTSQWCSECEGKRYLARWLPLETLRFLTEGTYLIFGYRRIAREFTSRRQ